MVTKAKYKPDLNEELARIKAAIMYEDELSHASEDIEISELFNSAKGQCDEYYRGFADGFWDGRELDLRYGIARLKSVFQKYAELEKRFGLN